MGVAHLNRATNEKNDEYYTRYEDVIAELRHYSPDLFYGAVVYCNCDTEESELYSAVCDMKDELGISEVLRSEVDFRSEESIEKLKKSDIVITNPPFSLLGEYVAQLCEYEKDYLIIIPLTALSSHAFPIITQEQARVGYENPVRFNRPSGEVSSVFCLWLTTFPVKQRKIKIKSEIAKIPYDNYPEAIEVQRIGNIDETYMGLMGVPITFLSYDTSEYDIIALRKDLKLNGKQVFARIIVKRKET